MIGAVAPWYGSKRTLAPEIVQQLGKHRVYWEPFCGSCAVLFGKPRVTYESVNDLHDELINLTLVLQDESTAQELYARTTRTLFHEGMLPRAKSALRESFQLLTGRPDVERAYWYIVFSWMGVNGISGTPLSSTGTFAARYSGKGGNGATRWRSVVESIQDWHERLIGVQILQRDALKLLASIDDAEGTAIYVDPPYIAKGSKYVHDADDSLGDVRRILGAGPDDPLPKHAWHFALAKLLHRFRKARIVLSYYDHPLLAQLYPGECGWWRKNCAIAKSMGQSGKRDKSGRTIAPEVLLVNGPLVRADGVPESDLFGGIDHASP